MRIVLFTDTYPPELNGVATSIFTLRNLLIKNNHDVLIVTIDRHHEIFNYDTINKVIYISNKQLDSFNNSPITSSAFIKNLEVLIKDFKPDVIHAQTGWGICSISLKVADDLDIPLVFTYLHLKGDYIKYATGEKHIKGIKKLVIKNHVLKLLNRANEIVTTSTKNKDYIRSLVVNKYINVIPNSIDLEKFNKKDIKLIKDKKIELGINESAKIFLVVSKLDNKKRVDMVINGYSNFKRAHPEIDSVLLIVGNGPDYPDYIELVDKLQLKDNVKFIGEVNSTEISIFYKMSDLYLSASTNESQRLTYFEAIASKLLCLVRFDNELLDIIKDNETGFYFHNESDCAELIYKIINMSEDNLDLIKGNAISNIKEYSIDRYYQNILHVYERAIKENW